MPNAVRPNHLTAPGVLGAIGAGAGCALSSVEPAWLGAAAAGLVVRWLGVLVLLAMVGMLAARVARNLAVRARQEPQVTKRRP